jgi:diaminopimelate decarboxylase
LNLFPPHPFHYHRNHLTVEQVSIETLAEDVSTPFYVYSATDMERWYQSFDQAFSAVPHKIYYAVKANSNLEILRLFWHLGGGFDIVSSGELFRVLKVGADPRRVVFSGAGKTVDEIDFALRRQVGQFNVESIDEIRAGELLVVWDAGAYGFSLASNYNFHPRCAELLVRGKGCSWIRRRESFRDLVRSERSVTLGARRPSPSLDKSSDPRPGLKNSS